MEGYYTSTELRKMGITVLGDNNYVSKLARIYNPEKLILGSNVRIDDFTILSGKGSIEIKNYVHIASHVSITSSQKVLISDFCSLSSGVKLLGSSDDFSGKYLVGPTIPSKYLNVHNGNIILESYVAVAAGSIIMPNVILKEGSIIGAMSFAKQNTEEWKIYAGTPIKYIKNRDKTCIVYGNELLNV